MCPHRVHLGGLEEAELDRVIETLSPFVTEERRRRIEAAVDSRTREVVLVLEDIYDVHNASAVLRTADAFGVLEVHIVEYKTRFLLQPKTSIGAHKWLDLYRHKDPAPAYEELARRGYRIWASGVRGDAVPLERIDPREKVALVFGNEHQGLTEAAAAAAHGRFTIPMLGLVESLNVSVATAVSMYDVLLRKRQLGVPTALDPLEHKRLRAEWYALSVRGARPILARAGVPTGVRAPLPVAMIEPDPEEDGDEQLSHP